MCLKKDRFTSLTSDPMTCSNPSRVDDLPRTLVHHGLSLPRVVIARRAAARRSNTCTTRKCRCPGLEAGDCFGAAAPRNDKPKAEIRHGVLASAHPRAGVALVIGVFVLLTGLYSVVVPPFETPDEIWHYAFIQHLAAGRGLPVSEPNTQALWQQQGVQAPGYYLAAAALTAVIDQGDFPAIYGRANPHAAIGQPDATANRNYLIHHADEGWPWRGSILALHLARFFAVFLGAVTLWATYRALALIVAPRWALIGTALVGFIPQFVFISAAASNDNAINALAALVLWRLVALLVAPPEAENQTESLSSKPPEPVEGWPTPQQSHTLRSRSTQGAQSDFRARFQVFPEGFGLRVGARRSVGAGIVVQAERAGAGCPDRVDPVAGRLACAQLADVDRQQPGRRAAGLGHRRLVVRPQLGDLRRPAGVEHLAGQHPVARDPGRLGNNHRRAGQPGALLLGALRLAERALPDVGLRRLPRAGDRVYAWPPATRCALADRAGQAEPAGFRLAVGRRLAADPVAGAAGVLVGPLHAHRAGRARTLLLPCRAVAGAAADPGAGRLPAVGPHGARGAAGRAGRSPPRCYS